MSQKNATGTRAFITGEAIEPFRRVKPSTGTVVYADAGEDSIGVSTDRVASGGVAPVDLWSKPGTFLIEAEGAITQGAAVYGADDGKIKATASGSALGWALEAANAAGAIIEVCPTGPEA